MKKQNFHGSDIISVAKYYNQDINKVINFAGNVNPLGTSKTALNSLSANLNLAAQYPDRNYTNLKLTIANYCNTSTDKILVGNGSTELISLGIQHIAAKKAMILGPTYSEYKRELELMGCSLDEYTLSHNNNFTLDLEDLMSTLEHDYDFLIICNPNNPTGISLKHLFLSELIDRCNHMGIFVMIDETYIEFSKNISKTSAIPLCDTYSNLLVLRGFSKFFAAPGIRLGYGITGNLELIDKILAHQNPWSVSSYAEFLGQHLLEDNMFISETTTLIREEHIKFSNAFHKHNKFYCYPSDSNFFLLKILDKDLSSRDIFDTCMKNGLFIRDCNSFFGDTGEFIRFCIMMPEDNQHLINILNSF